MTVDTSSDGEALSVEHRELRLEVGDTSEDCAFHPVLCLGVDHLKDEVWGISLIDGSHPRSCSLTHCGVRKLTLTESWEIKMHSPSSEADAALIPADERWWTRSL